MTLWDLITSLITLIYPLLRLCLFIQYISLFGPRTVTPLEGSWHETAVHGTVFMTLHFDAPI
jgi:hypothetical protein